MRFPLIFAVLWVLGLDIGFADEISFNRDVRPILSDKCFSCHGPDGKHREADLRLDVEKDAKESAIIAGDVELSEVILRIISTDPDSQMPPPDSGKSLTAEQIELLKNWVREGAPYQAYWAYSKPLPQRIPDTQSKWPRDPIDRFVLTSQINQGMEPAKDADPVTLIRRLAFDLTGLPPSQRQVEMYVADPTRQTFARLVDEFLDSPAFGERMAIYWLDLVRYADTVGYHGDQDHNISPYRDYVIDCFNRDVPFDEFSRQQLAGDLLAGADDNDLVASGYNRLLQTSHEGGVQPKEYLAMYAADRIRNLSAVWFGATIGCAQCHDHKYDPYTIQDFYSLAAFFADVDEDQHFKVGSNALPTRRPPEMAVLTRWQRERLRTIDQKLSEFRSDSVKSENAKPSKSTKSKAATIARLEQEKAQLQAAKRTTMITQSTEPREMRVLPRGDWLDESGPIVTPSVPKFLGTLQTGDRYANRLDLANWLVDEQKGIGGLTARVMVNRLWFLLFGRGISSSLADFGGQGEPPTHPELLDHLAIQFVQDNWSIKRMMRRLVLTHTYQQSSQASPETISADPNNLWFARQSRYRLSAEMVRDQALTVSGLFIADVGGPSVRPHQPTGYYRHLNFPRRVYSPDRGSGQYRRGVYIHWQRQFLHPMLKAMDAPSREECTAQRPRSNTPLEALVLLNDPSLVDTSIALASRLLKRPAISTPQRLREIFQIVLSRPPDETEMSVLTDFFTQEIQHYRNAPQAATLLLESADDFVDTEMVAPVELASWTGVARLLLNAHETVTRQ
ncbi:MAG: PSD1 and planctomycete cytochrome C domain-containing protein [Planctomycetota bacterium]|nr:PSD1 and planctomycete cytochrome C domain-containing protein [Planctomycetota bacterium]